MKITLEIPDFDLCLDEDRPTYLSEVLKEEIVKELVKQIMIKESTVLNDLKERANTIITKRREEVDAKLSKGVDSILTEFNERCNEIINNISKNPPNEQKA